MLKDPFYLAFGEYLWVLFYTGGRVYIMVLIQHILKHKINLKYNIASCHWDGS